jgi:uncharacterized protein (DUF4415 family)
MKISDDFPFERARRVTKREVESARAGIEVQTGVPRPARGRPPKPKTEKYQATSIRLHPKAIAWARREARKKRVGYQTIINQVLLEKAG